MGVATGLIGLLPTYAQAGWIGAILLVLLRVIQGLSLGGEWGGSILLATEHSSPVKRAFYAAIPQLGSPVGSILVRGALHRHDARAAARGARGVGLAHPVPHRASRCCSSRSTCAGRSTRRRCSARSSPRGGATASRSPRCSAQRPVAIIIAIGAALLGIGSYSLMNTYTINYGVAELGFSFQDLLIATTIGGLLQLVTIPLFGHGRRGSARRAWSRGAPSAPCSSRSRCTSCCSSRPSRSSSAP